MRYDQPLFRPPSEAYSLILQATIGCSHNRCTFCSMYKMKKYRVRSLEEIFTDIRWARENFGHVRKVFLADGDALAMDTGHLLAVLAEINRVFPEVERISLYAGPTNILAKSGEELRAIREAGASLAYFGLESGDARVLEEVNKGVTPEEMVEAGRKIQEAGFDLSVTVILGLGGRERRREHAINTALAVSRINPRYLAALTLMVHKSAPLYRKIERGEFTLLTPRESLEELYELISRLEVDNCTFRSNHASNYFPVGGELPGDREKLLAALALAMNEPRLLKDERLRGL